MKAYQDNNNASGFVAYEAVPEGLIIQFGKSGTYIYKTELAGADHIKDMLTLAESGAGLNTYINKYTRSFGKKL